MKSGLLGLLLTCAAWGQAPLTPSGGGVGGGGSGTVTSVTILGTTNQISVAGGCVVTITGTCTISFAANPVMPSGTTATTQSQADNSTKLATTAYVDAGLGTKAASNASTTVNGQACALGSTCTVTGAPSGSAGGDLTGAYPNPTIAANAVTSAKEAVVNTRRTCLIDNDTQSATALVAANFSGRCVIPAAATIVEVDVIGGTGVITGSAGAPTVTGTSSIQIGKYTPNGGASTTGLLSAALATASGKACALAAISGTCINGNTSSGTVTISTTALAAGDVLYVSAATPDTAQTYFTTIITYTVN